MPNNKHFYKLILGDFKSNCYIYQFDNMAIIIDPACAGSTIADHLKSINCQLKAIFITHGHQDHIGAVDYLYNIYKCDVIAHYNDHDLIAGTDQSKILQIPSLKGIKVNAPVKYFNDEFQSWNINGVIVDGILTPGHTAGSVTYVLRDENKIFAGDTVFKGGVGKTESPTSSKEDLRKSIGIYKTFKKQCKIYPGHGPSTTVDSELKENDYFKY